MIPEVTLDLIDELANHGLKPRDYSGRFMYGKRCVAVVLSWQSGYSLEDLPLEGQVWDNLGLDTIVYWPDHPWSDDIQNYVNTIFDPSGDGVDE
jgi:hypothetical protein